MRKVLGVFGGGTRVRRGEKVVTTKDKDVTGDSSEGSMPAGQVVDLSMTMEVSSARERIVLSSIDVNVRSCQSVAQFKRRRASGD